MKKRKVYVMSSTHWDREWYQPFQQYRRRLVRMMDDLIEILENDPDYREFYFDGQTICLEDYLEIRPENRKRLAALIESGRIVIGPWYTMPDEFLVSGESLVRNLQEGIEICKQYGVKPFEDAYVCDIFGHNSQFPQIARGFGLDNAMLFRGIADLNKDFFVWEGADGSRLYAVDFMQDFAYSAFWYVVRQPQEGTELTAERSAELLEAYFASRKDCFTGDSIFMIDGVDHMDPEPRIPSLLAELNERMPEYQFVHGSIADYFAELRTRKNAEVVKGPLYRIAETGITNSVIRNVLSGLYPLKQHNDACETLLTLVDEPLDALTNRLRPGWAFDRRQRSAYPRGGFFRTALRELLKNHAHDSICGCSITATHVDCMNRFKQAGEILAEMKRDALAELSVHLDTTGRGNDLAIVLTNPTQVPVDGYRTVTLEIVPDHWSRNFRIYDEAGNDLDFNLVDVRKYIDREAPVGELIRFPRKEAYEVVLPIKLDAYETKVYTVDWLRDKFEPVNATGGQRRTLFFPPKRNLGSMRTGLRTVDNGCLKVTVNDNGTLDILDKTSGHIYPQLLTFESKGDVGDGWNYVEPMFNRELLSSACAAEIGFENDTPNLVDIVIRNELHLPKNIRTDRMKRETEYVPFVVESRVRVLRGEPRLLVTTTVANNTECNRLRVLFPTGLADVTLRTSTPFDWCAWDRSYPAADHSMEPETYVFPNQGAAEASDGKLALRLYNKALYETAYTETGALALTLFRAFPNEVGLDASDMGRLQTEMTFEYAAEFGPELSGNEVWARQNAFKAGLVSYTEPCHAGTLAPGMKLLQVTGGAVVSAVRSEREVAGEKMTVVRLFDADRGCAGTVKLLGGATRAYELDLGGNVLRELPVADGAVRYELGARKIVTLALA